MTKIFICFIGTDGSGKSTLAEHTYETLVQKKLRVRKVYGRYQPLLTRYLMQVGKRLFLKNTDRVSDYDKYLQDKRTLFRRASLLARIYIKLVLLEYSVEMLFKLVIPYRLGYSIVSDRYVYDTIVNDVAVDMALNNTEIAKIIERFWLFIPRPDLKFFVQVPEEVALKRKSDIPSAGYLKIRNEYYEFVATNEELIRLDGTIEIAQLKELIMNHICRFMSNR